MKKIISMLLVIALLLSVGCVSAFAEDESEITITGSISFVSYTGEDYFSVFDSYGVHNDAIAGATYDPDSNTLTINDFSHPDYALYASHMGSDFKIWVEGSCSLSCICSPYMFPPSDAGITLTGTGSLSVNENENDLSSISMSVFPESGAALSLTIEEGVTVDIYGETAISLYGSSIAAADESITADGKPIDGVESQEIVYEICDRERIAYLNRWNDPSDLGYRIKPKSDPDTEDVYTAVTYDKGKTYWVNHYVFIDSFNAYACDYSFSDDKMTEEELLEQYDFVIENQPVTAHYFTGETYDSRGSYGYQMTREGYPDDIYVGTVYWSWDSESDDPDGVYIYHVLWDEDQEYYVEDPSFDRLDYAISDLNQYGFSFVTTQTIQHKMINCWAYDSFEQEYSLTTDNDVVVKDDDPDTYFVASPYWYNDDGEIAGYDVYEIYQDDAGEYYFRYDNDGNAVFEDVDIEAFANSGYHFIDETVDEKVGLYFMEDGYDSEDYASEALLLKKGDKKYGLSTWEDYDEDNYVEKHSLIELIFNEKAGCYFAGETIEWDTTLEEVEAKGYELVTADQKVSFYLSEMVETSNGDIYTDDKGNRYVEFYEEGVYRINEDSVFTIGEEKYHTITFCEGLTVDDLNSTEKPYHTGSYRHWLKGEYHHQGTGSESAEGFTVSGSISSFKSDTDDITVQLQKDKEVVKSVTVQGNKADYAINGVKAGQYTLSVSKKNHATRDYKITVTGNRLQNVSINLLGDVDGDGAVNNFDYGRINSHARNKSKLTGYAFVCADIDGDGFINNFDAGRVNSHARGKSSIWT